MRWPLKRSDDKWNKNRLRQRPITQNLGSQNAFSYHAQRSLQQDRSVEGRVVKSSLNNPLIDKHPSKTKKLMATAVLMVIFLGVIFELFVNTTPKIIVIEPTGFSYQARSINQYQLAAKNALNSSVYNHLKLTISSKDVQTKMIDIDREIQFVSVTVPLIGSTPTLYIQLSRPALIYQIVGSSYLLNSDGTVIAKNDQGSKEPSTKLPVVQSSSNNTLAIGSKPLTSGNVSFVLTVFAALNAKNVPVNHVNLLSSAEELDAYIKNEPYFIKFNLAQADALQQVGTYLAVISSLNQQGKAPTQYIDVRVDGRAYYK